MNSCLVYPIYLKFGQETLIIQYYTIYSNGVGVEIKFV
ncbi:hypothetical protein TPY_2865 [Sulfobacillus acidophilus TPY]|nr:hypothetical protein TPY_2865 [Sulfobacillus acidophilus TPY]